MTVYGKKKEKMVKIMKDIQPQKIKIYIKDIYKAKDRNIELIINNK